jgi:rod shape-determining protein MreD
MSIPKQIFWILTLLYVQQLPYVSTLGVDLPLIFVVLTGLRSTAAGAAGWGFALGFLQDLLAVNWIGPNTISKTLVGLLSWLAKMHIYRERVVTQTFLIFCATLVHQFFLWLLLCWDGKAPSGGDAFWIILQSMVATSLAGAAVSWVVVRLRKRRLDPATA